MSKTDGTVVGPKGETRSADNNANAVMKQARLMLSSRRRNAPAPAALDEN